MAGTTIAPASASAVRLRRWIERERRLARHEHERASLLEHHVGRALGQVVGQAVRDRRPGSPSSRRHDHRVSAVRAGRDRVEQVVRVGDAQPLGAGQLQEGRQRDRGDACGLPVGSVEAELVRRHLAAGVGEDDGHVVPGEDQLLDERASRRRCRTRR